MLLVLEDSVFLILIYILEFVVVILQEAQIRKILSETTEVL